MHCGDSLGSAACNIWTAGGAAVPGPQPLRRRSALPMSFERMAALKRTIVLGCDFLHIPRH